MSRADVSCDIYAFTWTPLFEFDARVVQLVCYSLELRDLSCKADCLTDPRTGSVTD